MMELKSEIVIESYENIQRR